mgnify:CR=1 FL=1
MAAVNAERGIIRSFDKRQNCPLGKWETAKLEKMSHFFLTEAIRLDQKAHPLRVLLLVQRGSQDRAALWGRPKYQEGQ